MERLSILPENQQFDVALSNSFDELSARLQTEYQSDSLPNNEKYDMDFHDAIQVYKDALMRVFMVEKGGEVEACIERSIYFSYDVGMHLTPKGNNVYADILSVFKDKTLGTIGEMIWSESQEYLQHRVNVNNLIDSCMPELDPSGRYGELAEAITAYLIMHIELSNSDQFYMSEEVAAFRQKIEDYEKSQQNR